MGLFKESIQHNTLTFLNDLGFVLDTGPTGKKGYVKIIDHDSIERLWITIILSSDTVHLYNEYDCGGLLWERTLDIPHECINDKDKFIDWLDSMI